jgi:hypothetical protein
LNCIVYKTDLWLNQNVFEGNSVCIRRTDFKLMFLRLQIFKYYHWIFSRDTNGLDSLPPIFAVSLFSVFKIIIHAFDQY